MVEGSIRQNTLVCMETGAQMPVLTRHVRQTLGMTPDQYRRKWRLPADYPMVSRGYSERRAAVRSMMNRE